MSKPYINKEAAPAAGQNAWKLSNGETEVALTVKDGQMAPVKFFADTDRPVEPYYISPWQEESEPVDGPVFLNHFGGIFSVCLSAGIMLTPVKCIRLMVR